MLCDRKDIILLVVQAVRDITTLTEVYFMAKKTAPKKKASPAKAKAAKPAKVKRPAKSSKPIKFAKSAVKVVKAVANMLKPEPAKTNKSVPIKVSKPALMTQKGKKSVIAEVVENPVVKKSQTIVSMMEAESTPAADASKVEKTSKIKPVKVDRGNLADEKAKWAELSKKYAKEKALTYKMTESYPASVPLQHKVLGWGYILTNENDRLEVLFENGIRMLISNYKS